MFKIGDIITGKRHNEYGVTTADALMIVRNTWGNAMDVFILAHDDSSEWLTNHYDVDNNDNKFALIEPSQFWTEIENRTYSMSEHEIECQLIMYGSEALEYKGVEVQTTETTEEPYVLSDEKRAELHTEIKELLIKYHYHPTQDGIDKILDEWLKNKAPLIRLFEKHPNYNGNFQIVFSHDYNRGYDFDKIRAFSKWFEAISEDMFLKEIVLDNCPYADLRTARSRCCEYLDIFRCYEGIETINGCNIERYYNERDALDTLIARYHGDDNIVTNGYSAYDANLYNKKNQLHYLGRRLRSESYIDQLVNDNFATFANDYMPEYKIRQGQKLSRAVNKILTGLGFNKLEDYNREYAKFADAVNPLKVKRHTVISVHPVDYFTMSFGNSWSSCHTIDKKNDRGVSTEHHYRGCNSSGTESYLLDGTSSIFYTVDASYDGNQFELQDKINRCMFHYGDNRLVQGRVYPQSKDGDSSLYTEIREIAQKVFADMLGVPNYWTLQTGTGYCSRAIRDTGTHYPDYEHFDNCNVSTLKDGRESHDKIRVGHYPICPSCGKTHSDTESIECCW